eukprot:1322259-Pyramimonas_sp.AAC.2
MTPALLDVKFNFFHAHWGLEGAGKLEENPSRKIGRITHACVDRVGDRFERNVVDLESRLSHRKWLRGILRLSRHGIAADSLVALLQQIRQEGGDKISLVVGQVSSRSRSPH